MPSYKSTTIKSVMKQIGAGKFFLPAIQRKFVWGPDQICKLFDSIMRNYPIGTFLFWEVAKGNQNDYVFYKFISRYSEFDAYNNEIAERPYLSSDITGVLDGQQRLNSMYVALQGSYAYHLKRRHRSKPESYPTRQFYINLAYSPSSVKEHAPLYEFKFLRDDENLPCDEKNCWFLIKDLLKMEQAGEVMFVWMDFYDSAMQEKVQLCQDRQKTAMSTLTTLFNRLITEEVINYFPVDKQELDEILDIFVRVNSGGKVLSKTDLLFSTIIANWADGREQIEATLETLNKKGEGFNFDTDWIMRACLTMSDAPVKLQVSSFGSANVKKITDEWSQLQVALGEAINLLVKWGFSRDTLTSNNAVIPIAHAIYKGCDIDKSHQTLRLYLIRSLVKRLFSAQGDRLLGDLRKYLDSILDQTSILKMEDFENVKLPSGKTLKIDDEDIDSLLQMTKGPATFAILSLLYPQLKYDQHSFHQDHIHPTADFAPAKLKKIGLIDEDIFEWRARKDTLPNLQLLEGRENQSKNKKLFSKWFDAEFNSDEQQMAARERHFLTNESFEFENFIAFYDKRSELLKSKLATALLTTF